MIDNAKVGFDSLKKLMSPPLLIEIVIILLVIVWLYYYDRDNAISFRRCLLERKWTEASYPFFSLLITLVPWIMALLGIALIPKCFLEKHISNPNIDKLNNFLSYMMTRYFFIISAMVIVAIAHLVMFDDTASKTLIEQKWNGTFAFFVGIPMLYLIFIKVTTR